jgi:hypothetical protein
MGSPVIPYGHFHFTGLVKTGFMDIRPPNARIYYSGRNCSYMVYALKIRKSLFQDDGNGYTFAVCDCIDYFISGL